MTGPSTTEGRTTRYVSELDDVPGDSKALIEALIEEPEERLLLELPEQYEVITLADQPGEYDPVPPTDYFDRLADDFTHHTSNPFEGGPLSTMNKTARDFPAVRLYTTLLANAEEHAVLHIQHTNDEQTLFRYGPRKEDGEGNAVIDTWRLYDIYNTACIDAERDWEYIIKDDPTELKGNESATLGEPDEPY